MPIRPNPLDQRYLPQIQLSEDAERRFVTEIVQDGLRADNARLGWLERQRVLTRLRFGMRKPKTFPWPGCSNLSIPLIDVAIRKMKPVFMRLLVEADPVVEFTGDDFQAVEREREAEETYNWLFKTEMDALEPMAYVIDTFLHRGQAFAQAGWDYRTEYECRIVNAAELIPPEQRGDPEAILQILAQQYDIDLANPAVVERLRAAIQALMLGAPYVKIAHRVAVADKPALWDRDPVQIIVPPRSTEVEHAEWIVVQHIISARRLQQMEADGFFRPGSVGKILGSFRHREEKRMDTSAGDVTMAPGLNYEKITQDERDRIWGTEDEDNVLVWEVFHWFDLDGDGLADRAHSWIHPKTNTILALRPYVFPFHAWPLVKFDFEKTNRRWHSPRGISAYLEGLQREVNAQHNARLDAMTIRNAPTFQMPKIAGFQARNFRAVPGTVLQLPAGVQLAPLISDRGAFPEQLAEENLLRSLAEQYVGILDPLLSSPGSSIKGRTATEVQAAVQNATATASLDTILFQMSMRKVHTFLWQLFIEFGQKEIYVKVLGEDSARELRLVRKADIARRFTLIPTGTIANTNRAVELQQARDSMLLFLQDQSGFINPFELRRWYLNLLDFRWARRILNSPEEAQELVTIRQAAQALQENPELQQTLFGQAQSGEAPQPPTQEIQEDRS